MKKCQFIVLSILFSFNIIVAEDIPDTKAGRMLREVLSAFKNGVNAEFFTSNFNEDFLNEFPMSEHEDFFRMVREIHGGFEVKEILSSVEYEIEVLAKSINKPQWRKILVSVSERHPYKINGIGIDEAPIPNDAFDSMTKIEIVRPDQDNSIIKSGIAERIDKYMTKMEKIGFSGGVIFSRNGDIKLSKGYGYMNRDKMEVFNSNTLFTIGSITKQFTGAAAVKLESMGLIDFDNKISDYFKNTPEDKKDITIHQLLTHTAGFPGAIGDDREWINRDEFIKKAMSTNLVLKPGEKYRYSNVGYSLTAAIIEIASGKSYEEFLREHIFLPAKLYNTGYILPDWDENNIVTGYSGEGKWGRPTDKLWSENGPGWHLIGNGAIISTLEDMNRWGEIILNNELFTEDEYKNYLTPYVEEETGGQTFYSYGWVRATSSRGTDVIMHNGGNPYISNDMYIYPEDGVVIYLTSNNGALPAYELSNDILKLIFY